LPSTDPGERLESGAGAAEAALRDAALVVIEAGRGVLEVRGSERVSWLNGVVTCDAAKVTDEHAGFGLLLSKQGKIQSDFFLVGDGERLLLAVAPGTAELVRAELDRMLVMEDVELVDVSAELALFSLHGPRARELARDAVLGGRGAAGALDRTGLGGAVLVVGRRLLDDVASRLESAGARIAAGDDWSRVRVAHGIGEFAADFGPSDNPHEAALERRAIAWDKGCYLGQEAVFMQDARGKVKRRLVVLSVKAAASVPPGAVVERLTGERIGEVTSAADGARAGEQLALARVHAPDFEPGAEVLVAGARARVVARAFEPLVPRGE
jgi:folate-binding protein YgfZ